MRLNRAKERNSLNSLTMIAERLTGTISFLNSFHEVYLLILSPSSFLPFILLREVARRLTSVRRMLSFQFGVMRMHGLNWS